jgi:hypothetical protein
VAHPRLKRLFEACQTAEERIEAKERFVRDVVLDCYQHSFKLEDLPEQPTNMYNRTDDGKARHLFNHDVVKNSYQ